VIVIVAVVSLLTFAYAILGFFNAPIGCGTSNTPVSARFTVYIDYIRRPLPMMNVTRGETITIHAWNNGTVTHGFAIRHYFDQGTFLQPGQSCDLTFTASQTGTFWVYSNEPDPVFELAQLNVNP
jgi:heme/copper-type cytochrome/quinol oxidase subunit 2